ncbi:zinc metalloproteinase nas-4-like [Schistocerca piceifrons]|nr:zinc metalloproteinase nas-4-like [Schistocerca piceifrons]
MTEEEHIYTQSYNLFRIIIFHKERNDELCTAAKKEENMVTEAMEGIENKTCVKFTKQEKQKQYIFLTKKRDGCYSMVGYRATAQAHTLNLQSPECFDQVGTIQHELLHVLGLLHEQARPDRDDFVKIYWDNMDKGRLGYI